MRRTWLLLLGRGVLVWITIALATAQTQAAAPRLIMFHGKLLPKPVILDDWKENLQLMAVRPDAAVTRDQLVWPYLQVAYFWGPRWVRYVQEGKPLDKLHPEEGDQHLRFYPAVE